MAKKNKNIEVIGTELKPQTIGYVYKKKSNILRVLFVLVIFGLAIYYINDISIYINNLLGRNSAETIKDIVDEEGKQREERQQEREKEKETAYYTLEDAIEITSRGVKVNNFKYDGVNISFDVVNDTSGTIDLKDYKYYLEIYDANKVLLTRHKVDINVVSANNKVSFEFPASEIQYIVFEEKTVEKYDAVTLESNKLTCTKGNSTIVYNFENNKLLTLEDTYNDNDINDSDYSIREVNAQDKVRTYSNMDGINASLSINANGYKIVISLDLQKVNLNVLEEKYYYPYNEDAKVIDYEMRAYGFNCK